MLAPALLSAQGRQLELHVGRWYGDNHANTYELRTSSSLGILRHGFTMTALVNDSLGRHRAFYGLGYDVLLFRGGAGFRPYALLGAALGLSTDTLTQEFAVQWSVGGGLEWRPVSRFAVGAESRYRLEDRGPRGFWRADAGRRKGVSGAVGVSIGLGAEHGAVTTAD